MNSSTLITMSSWRKPTKFRVTFDPEWSVNPMDPFPGHTDSDPGIFLYRMYGCQ